MISGCTPTPCAWPRPSLSRTLKPVTFAVQNSKGSRSQISSKQIITIADEAAITASTNVLLIYVSKQTVLCVRARTDRTQSLQIHRARLAWNWKSGNKIIVYQLPVELRMLRE